MDPDHPPTVNWMNTNTFLVGPECQETYSWEDLHLRIAADICTEMRQEIYDQLGYTCSAGIAHNKTLAKLVSSMNKPNKQTALLESRVLDFMKDLDFSKIRGLGGKLGEELENILQVEKAGELWATSLDSLQNNLGDANGLWVYQISRGICHDPVTPNEAVKSMAACKSFRPSISTDEKLSQWLDILSVELYTRLLDDYEMTKRWPKTLCLIANRMGLSRSRSCPMPSKQSLQSPCILANKAFKLFKMDADVYPCSRIAITLSGMEKLEEDQTDILTFFIKKSDMTEPVKCKTCFMSIEKEKEMEHMDWHVAMDLAKEWNRQQQNHREIPKKTKRKLSKIQQSSLDFFIQRKH
jgi:DNA polymerase eta